MTNRFSENARFIELENAGLAKYHEVMDWELGDNNALIAAFATIVANSEVAMAKSYWKEPGPCLVPDDGPSEFTGRDTPTEVLTDASTQLRLPGI